MGTYAYLPPRINHYRPRGRTSDRNRLIGLAVGLVLAAAVASSSTAGHTAAGHPASSGAVAVAAISYAEQQIGKPYLWGGTGPDAFDCSGLAMEAYASAGVTIERTSQEQWVSERHVTSPVAGDLVFFPGVDGTWAAPGHVGIVTDPARHRMIDAYSPSVPVETTGYGPAATLPGLGEVVGYTQPWGS